MCAYIAYVGRALSRAQGVFNFITTLLMFQGVPLCNYNVFHSSLSPHVCVQLWPEAEFHVVPNAGHSQSELGTQTNHVYTMSCIYYSSADGNLKIVTR